jgi:hypothetical protein
MNSKYASDNDPTQNPTKIADILRALQQLLRTFLEKFRRVPQK